MKKGALLLLAIIVGCSRTQPSTDDNQVPAPPVVADATAAAPAPPEVNPRDQIESYIFEPYSRQDFPKLFARLGSDAARFQRLREGAAYKALASGKCDHVEISEISDDSTKANLIAFVDCTNKERFLISEADLKDGETPLAQSERVVDRTAAIQACSDAAKSRAKFPSLVDTHTWAGASFTSNKTTGNARVLLDFEATNALGVELPYKASCLFPAGGAPLELHIAPR